jgi:hypothetical protein
MNNIKIRYIVQNTETGQVSTVFKKIEDIEARGMAKGIKVLRRDIFTGRKDCSGKSIYENDILEDEIKAHATVFYEVFKGQFYVGYPWENVCLAQCSYCKVIGFVFPKIKCNKEKNEPNKRTQPKKEVSKENAIKSREEKKEAGLVREPAVAVQEGKEGTKTN